jgi:LysR family transcriptional regulator, regulator for metE and metH
MNLEVRHLKLIVAVAEEGSVTKAGNRLHLTQSALSHQLHDIEQKMGTPLFLRLNKRMLLTQAGERLLGSARLVLTELKRAEEDIQQVALNRQGILRISTECYTCYHWLPSMMKEFNRKFPLVEVRIDADATREPIEALLNGKLDLAIVHDPIRNRKLLRKPLFKDELVVIMNPEHRLASQKYIKARDFADETLLLYSIPKEASTVFQKILIPAGVTPRNVMHIQLTEAIIEMVKAGIGLSVMAKWAVMPQIREGTIRALPLTCKGFTRQWSAAMIKSNSVPSYILEFVKLLVKK